MEKIVLFYDEYPSDLHQHKSSSGIISGTFIYHNGIDNNLLFEEDLLKQLMLDNELRSCSVYIEKTESISKFLKSRFIKYKSKKTKEESIYNTSDFIWCSLCSYCFATLYKELLNKPLTISIYYDPKSLNKKLKREFYLFLQQELILMIKKILKKNIPTPQIDILEGTKEMMGIKIADKKAREHYEAFNGDDGNITKIIEPIVNKLLEVGNISDDRKKLASDPP